MNPEQQRYTLPDGFTTVSLQELESAGISRRRETKYLLHVAMLTQLSNAMQGCFAMLEDSGTRRFSYITDYFDTADYKAFRDHLAAVPGRLKLRIRRYENAGKAMFEIKRKGGDGRTHKSRTAIPYTLSGPAIDPGLLSDAGFADAAAWRFSLQTRYERMSFLALDRSLRVSVDTNIKMIAANGGHVALPELVVVELKTGTRPAAGGAALRKILRALGAVKTPFSKYMLGMSLLHPELYSGVLKPRGLALQKLRIKPCFL